jgi:hypothetical protein
MAANATDKTKAGRKPEQTKVTVSFPLAGKGPFKQDVEPTTTIDAVRVEAMAHFEVADDQSTVYYLTHKGDRPDGGATVGDLADEAHAVKFTLAKELVQG